MDNAKEIVIAVISALSGGGLASFFTYKTNKTKHNLSEIHEILEAGKDLRRELTDMLEEQTTKIELLEQKIERFVINENKLRKEILVLRGELIKLQK